MAGQANILPYVQRITEERHPSLWSPHVHGKNTLFEGPVLTKGFVFQFLECQFSFGGYGRANIQSCLGMSWSLILVKERSGQVLCGF